MKHFIFLVPILVLKLRLTVIKEDSLLVIKAVFKSSTMFSECFMLGLKFARITQKYYTSYSKLLHSIKT